MKRGLLFHTPTYLRVCPEKQLINRSSWKYFQSNSPCDLLTETEKQALTIIMIIRDGLSLYSQRDVKLPNGELSSLPSEGIFARLGDEDDPRDEHCPLRASYLADEQLVVQGSLVDEPGPIAETLSRIEVAKKHQWLAGLQNQVVSWEAVWRECVKIFNVEAEQIF